MAKKKDGQEEIAVDVTGVDDESSSPSHKKHKKHKKHKHKSKKRGAESLEGDLGSDPTSQEDESPSKQPAIKLKIKIGGQTLGTKSVTKQEIQEKTPSPTSSLMANWDVATGEEPTFPTKKPGDDTSDEEREWLEALEAGKLDETGGLKKDKDPMLLTARQRALLHGKQEEPMLALPTGYKTPELTEEQLQRKQQRAKKRREQAHAKTEKDKKLTLDRLLKKQETKSKGSKGKMKRADIPRFRYKDTSSTITISVPEGFNFPLPVQKAPSVPKLQKCGVAGCTNMKRYSCSKTGVPLCGLECYKQNLVGKTGLGKNTVPVTVM